jgi:hypothetical protein
MIQRWVIKVDFWVTLDSYNDSGGHIFKNTAYQWAMPMIIRVYQIDDYMFF